MASRFHLIEEKLLPIDSVDQLAEYRRRLLARYTRPQVAGCLEFLLGKARGEEVEMSPTSRATYRKMLASLLLVEPRDRPPDHEIGAVPIVALAAVAGVLGTVAALAAHPGALVAVAPIIRDPVNPEVELVESSNCCWEPPALLAA